MNLTSRLAKCSPKNTWQDSQIVASAFLFVPRHSTFHLNNNIYQTDWCLLARTKIISSTLQWYSSVSFVKNQYFDWSKSSIIHFGSFESDTSKDKKTFQPGMVHNLTQAAWGTAHHHFIWRYVESRNNFSGRQGFKSYSENALFSFDISTTSPFGSLNVEKHDGVIVRNIFGVTGLLCGEFPRTKAGDAELLYFLWSAPEPTVVQAMESPVIGDAIALIVTSL